MSTGTLVFFALVALGAVAILLLFAFAWGVAYAVSTAVKLLREADQAELDPFRRKHA
jgi:hypothetical protein